MATIFINKKQIDYVGFNFRNKEYIFLIDNKRVAVKPRSYKKRITELTFDDKKQEQFKKAIMINMTKKINHVEAKLYAVSFIQDACRMIFSLANKLK